MVGRVVGSLIDWSIYQIQAEWDHSVESIDPVFLDYVPKSMCTDRLRSTMKKIYHMYLNLLKAHMSVSVGSGSPYLYSGGLC